MNASRSNSIQGRTALVTGANRGIGRSFVDALVSRGAARVYATARTPESLADVLGTHGDRVVPVRLDLTDQVAVDAAASDCGDVDLLICNAGQAAPGGFLAADGDERARHLMEVNYFGPLRVVRAFAPALAAHRGGIVMVLSIGALALSRSSPVYSASKAASTMMALSVREELRSAGVGVTNVFPGYVATDMNAGSPMPMAAPGQIVDRALDAWSDGEPTVFPDRYAQLTRDALTADLAALLSTPIDVMNAVKREVAAGSPAGL